MSQARLTLENNQSFVQRQSKLQKEKFVFEPQDMLVNSTRAENQYLPDIQPLIETTYRDSRAFFKFIRENKPNRASSDLRTYQQSPVIVIKKQLNGVAEVMSETTNVNDSISTLLPNIKLKPSILLKLNNQKRKGDIKLDAETIRASVYQEPPSEDESIKEQDLNEDSSKDKLEIELPDKAILQQYQEQIALNSTPGGPIQSNEYAIPRLQIVHINTTRVGLPAVKYYYNKYKEIDRNMEKGHQNTLAPVAYLKQCNKYNLIPSPCGLVARKGMNAEINIKSYLIGNTYAEALGSGLKLSNAKVINLAQNRLTNKGGIKILEGLNPNVLELDLSNNQIGQSMDCMQQLQKIIIDKNYKIQTLMLSQNKIADDQVIKLCETLVTTNNKTLLHLNLANNNITDKGALAIADLIDSNSTEVRVLELQWNDIKTRGGIKIMQALRHNNKLKSLNLSWNVIGSLAGNQPSEQRRGSANISQTMTAIQKLQLSQISTIGTELGNLAIQNTTLVHLDLSFNKLSKIDIDIFADKLVNNHTLYGIHMQGNDGYTDSLGFVHTKILKQSSPRVQHLNFDFKRHQLLNKQKLRSHQSSPRKDVTIQQPMTDNCCWSCELWQEIEFNIDLQGVITNAEQDVYVHFSFDKWEPNVMVSMGQESTTSQGKFQLYKMVPQGTHFYFFSSEGKAFLNKKGPQQDMNPNLLRKIQKAQFMLEGINDLGYLNFIEVNSNRKVLSADFQPLLLVCVPRPNALIRQKIRIRTPWTYELSVFKEYLKEKKPQLLVDCFEFDWKQVKQLKYKVSKEEEIKEAMRECYAYIKEAYKVYSGYGMIGGIFSIALNQFTEMVKDQLGIVDDVNVNLADADRFFITVNSGKRGPFIPANALVRFQFVEILLRLAIKRYYDSGVVASEVAAIQQMNTDNIKPAYDNIQFDAMQWRFDKTFNEPTDNILKAYTLLFQNMYNTFGGTHRKPGQKMFMTVDEFENFVMNVPLVNDIYMQRDLFASFNLGMMTQVNELDTDRHLSATYIEFLEAFCRVIDKASFPPPTGLYAAFFASQNLPNALGLNQQSSVVGGSESPVPESPSQTNRVMSLEDRKAQPMHVKIYNVIPILFINCCKKNFKDKFEHPIKDEKVGLYLLPNGKFS